MDALASFFFVLQKILRLYKVFRMNSASRDRLVSLPRSSLFAFPTVRLSLSLQKEAADDNYSILDHLIVAGGRFHFFWLGGPKRQVEDV